MALKRPATQENTFEDNNASLATDGDINTRSCTNYSDSQSPFWQVDLGAEYSIDTIIIYPDSGK
jgi:hypothetical protein